MMREWREQQSNLIKEIQAACRQPYTEGMIGAPVIHPLRVSALMMAFTEEERQTNLAQKQITAAVLIQLALDTHDLIQPHMKEVTKASQLIVLAGDYYSGKYFQTLAEAGSIEWVGLLADAVKSVNEQKTMLHFEAPPSAPAVLQAARVIEGEIILAAHRKMGTSPALQKAVELVLTAERFLHEQKQPGLLFQALEKTAGKEGASGQIDHFLTQLYKEAQQIVPKLEEDEQQWFLLEWRQRMENTFRLVEER